jgi:putative transcriptional regulator
MSASHITIGHDFMNAPQHDGWLTGQLLVSTPQVRGDVFTQSVVYVFMHDDHGAMGVIINKPLDMVNHPALFKHLGIEYTPHLDEMNVYQGGPVDEYRGYIIHSPDYITKDTLVHESGIAVSVSTSILHEIAAGRGPRNKMLMIGCAGWAGGQLEAEIEANSWITVPATPELVFSTEDDAKWVFSAKSLGVDMVRFSHMAGHA